MSCAGLWVRRIWAEGRYRRPEHNTLGEEKERGGGQGSGVDLSPVLCGSSKGPLSAPWSLMDPAAVALHDIMVARLLMAAQRGCVRRPGGTFKALRRQSALTWTGGTGGGKVFSQSCLQVAIRSSFRDHFFFLFS